MSSCAVPTEAPGKSEEEKTVTALKNAKTYFLLYSLFDAWMVVCAAIQLWALSAPTDSEVAVLFVGHHPDTSALSQTGLVITGMCFSCDVVIGITVVKQIAAITLETIAGTDWSSLLEMVTLNWHANLVTLVIWLFVKIMLFRHGGWARIFGLVFVCIIRAGKIVPLMRFKECVDPLCEDEDQSEKNKMNCEHEEEFQPDFRLLHQRWSAVETHTDVVMRQVAKCCAVMWVVILIAVAMVVYSAQQPEEGTVVYAATPSAPPLTAAPALRQLQHSTVPPPSLEVERILMSKGDLKAGIVYDGAMWCCPQVHNCGLEGDMVQSYFNGDVAGCEDGKIAQHVFHHKVANAAKAGGGGAVSAALTCAAMSAETGPAMVVAGSACGIAAGLGLGGAVYVSLSEPDACLDECSMKIPSHVADILFCTPSPDQCRASGA